MNATLNTNPKSVLVIGQGGREHAICKALYKSPHVVSVYVCPGNDGMKEVAICLDKNTKVLDFVIEKDIDLTIVGGEQPLAEGIVDAFLVAGRRIIGPTKAAAKVETSKAWAKDIMVKYGIPTATYETFTDAMMAKSYLRKQTLPIVIKADGPAAGKGVVIAHTLFEAEMSIDAMISERKYGQAGLKVVIEEYLEGPEISLLAFVTGNTVTPFPLARDYKRVHDGDKGPNTGGMGAISYGRVDDDIVIRSVQEIIRPMAEALVAEDKPFTGILYAGLMETKQGLKVIEFNARFGDPETEVLLLRLENDFYEILDDVANLKGPTMVFSDFAALGVVVASSGYPEFPIIGHPLKRIHELKNVDVCHMGTKKINDTFVTQGGRVLMVSALGKTIEEIKIHVYRELEKIVEPHVFWRKDIGNIKKS